MIIYAYVVLVFLVIRFSVTLFNYISNPKLGYSVKHYNDFVSILIPARNEAANIISLLLSIKNQDYENYEVIVLDDNSTDETYSICETFCKADARFSVIKGNELPKGWMGKNYACHQLSLQGKGDFLLFLDADTQIKRGLINALINRCKLGKLALLSVYPNQVMQTFSEKITVPLIHFILLNLLPLRLVKLAKSSVFAAASGQCMFFDAQNCRKHHWHQQVKNKLVEDTEITKLMKQHRYKVETLLSNRVIYCRMYSGFSEAITGFSKNILANFGNNILSLVVYLALVIVGPIVLFFSNNVPLIVFFITLIVLSRVMISFLSGQKVWLNILLHPLQIAFFFIIALASIKNRLLKTGKYRGRWIYQH